MGNRSRTEIVGNILDVQMEEQRRQKLCTLLF